jgi:hypothetical protein
MTLFAPALVACCVTRVDSRTRRAGRGSVKAGESAGEFPNRSPECASSAAYGRDMANKHIRQTIGDLDGSVIEDGTSVTFSLEGRSYEIDQSSDNAHKLRDAFRPYMTAARPVGSSPSPPRRMPRGRAIPTRDVIDVRSRTQKNGFSITDRGRISATVLAASDAAH